MKRLLTNVIFVIVIILLAFISFLSYRRTNKLVDDTDWVEHSYQVKLKLTECLSNLTEGASAVRGFQLTKDLSNLKPYDSSRQKENKIIDQLKELTVDNPIQIPNIILLQKLIGSRFAQLDDIVKYADRPTDSLAPLYLKGREIMDSVRAQVSKMDQLENDLLLQRQSSKERSAFITPFYTMVLAIAAIFIIAIAYLNLKNEIRLRSRAEDSEAVIHNFFMQVPAAMAILKGPQHIFEFTNPLYLELIGNRWVIGKTVQEALPEVAGQGYYELLDKVYQTGVPFTGVEMPLDILKEGGKIEHVSLNFTYQALTNKNAEIEGIMVFCYDVSDMVTSRKKIQEAEERARLAVEAADMGTFDWDFTDSNSPLSSSNFLSSPRLKEIFGFKPDEAVTHLDLLSRYHPDDKVARDRAVIHAYGDGRLFYEARVFWSDGFVHWLSVHGKIIFNDQMQPARMYGTVIDITPQKKVIEEIRESEERFRLLADSMPEMVWTGDQKGNIDYFNKAVYDYSGLSDEGLQHGGWIDIVHPDDREENIQRWMQSVKSGKEFSFEHRFRNSNGDYRWQLSRALPQFDSSGKIHRWVGSSSDIQGQKDFVMDLENRVKERTASLKTANDQLAQIVHELEQSNSELKSFNYVASHDLQEPLRKIMAFCDRIMYKEKDKMSDFSRDYFDRIVAATARMRNLIDAFLSYSQTDSANLQYEKTDLNKLVDEAIAELHDELVEKKAVIDCSELPSLPVVRIQAQQLFMNVISNALKYKKPDVDPVINISSKKISGEEMESEGADPEKEYWKISVQDNGIGFEQQYEHKIFELFQRLHGKAEYAGTGIGLAICKKIMNNHNGFISASGKSREGAVFNFYFPV